MQIQHSIFAHIDGIKEVLDHWVGRYLLAGKLVCLGHQLAEVGEGNAAIFLNIKL